MHLTRAPSVPHRYDPAGIECVWCGCTATLMEFARRPFCDAAPECEVMAQQQREAAQRRFVPPWERG